MFTRSFLFLLVLAAGCTTIRQRPASPPALMEAPAELPPPPTVPGPSKDCPALLTASMACTIGGTVVTFLAGPAGVSSLRGTEGEPRSLPVLQLVAGALAAGADACAVYAAARLMAQCQVGPGE